MKNCIDISNWQGVVPESVWKKNRGKIPCVILRCSYTSFSGKLSLHEDKSFEQNFANAVKAGMTIGAYHYSQAMSESEARQEAEFAVKILKRVEKKYKARISLPVAFDYEFGGRLTASYAKRIGKQRVKQICDSFCRVLNRNGYQQMIYANLSTLNGYIASDIYKYYPIWVAQYHSRCDYKHPYYMWQYTSSGKVNGISGRIDMNYLYGQSKASEDTKPTKYPYELPKLPKRGWFASGDKGDEVKKLQRFLNWYSDYGLRVDGEVGRKTINAVKKYQGREKLRVDGAFGKECLKRAKAVKR